MRVGSAVALVLTLCLGPAMVAVAVTQGPALPLEPVARYPWPLQISAVPDTVVVYPPELQAAKDGRVEGTCAIAVRASEDAQPRFGIVRFQARAVPDVSNPSAIAVQEFQALDVDFPSEPQRVEGLLQQIQSGLSGVIWQTTQSRLQNALAIGRAQARGRTAQLHNDAPRILFSQGPAVLVPIDGAPALRSVEGTDLQHVVNTRALMLFDKSTGRYYLRLLGQWFEAQALDGPWTQAAAMPDALDRVREQLAASPEVDLLEEEAGTSSGDRKVLPAVLVSTVPAELIQTDGPPEWAAVTGTRLLYVTNSGSSVFYDLQSQAYYILLSGRWYRASALSEGQWRYVGADQLPADFARVPEGHPVEPVRASVAGTPEAREATIATSVPQTATVQRASTTLEVAYDGPPRFEPIPGTTLEWAVNARIPVIRVSAYSYYALENGIWFTSISPDAGWKVADSVPAPIYAIPPSSPLHYVTYVRVYDSTPDIVYVGYTPGYLGWYPTYEQTVVYGTGWWYRPWIGSYWYGWPSTWGCGCCYPWWGPWPGWYYAWWPRPVVWYPPAPAYHPWWGPRPVFVSPFAHRLMRPAPGVALAGPVTGGVSVSHLRANAAHVPSLYDHWGPRLRVTPTTPSVMQSPSSMQSALAPAPARPASPTVGAVRPEPAPAAPPVFGRLPPITTRTAVPRATQRQAGLPRAAPQERTFTGPPRPWPDSPGTARPSYSGAGPAPQTVAPTPMARAVVPQPVVVPGTSAHERTTPFMTPALRGSNWSRAPGVPANPPAHFSAPGSQFTRGAPFSGPVGGSPNRSSAPRAAGSIRRH